jgi:hypothetical protein
MLKLPQKKGALSCNEVGEISIILENQSDALPPACSIINTAGLHWYNKFSFPFGALELIGDK